MEAMEEGTIGESSVLCLLTDPEGQTLGGSVYLPHTIGPVQLQQIVNTLLQEERLPYAFYISDQELVEQLGAYLQKNKVLAEKVLRIVYQPQAIFSITLVNRSSATIAGWDFADCVLHRLVPLWVGARGLEFTQELYFLAWPGMTSLTCPSRPGATTAWHRCPYGPGCRRRRCG